MAFDQDHLGRRPIIESPWQPFEDVPPLIGHPEVEGCHVDVVQSKSSKEALG